MNRLLKSLSITLMCMLILSLLSRQAISTELSFSIPSYTVGSGGGRSNNETFEIAGSIEIPNTEQTNGEKLSISSGFWQKPFDLESQKTLSITKLGSGTVTSNPAGISCGTTCTYNFNRSSEVILTATESSDSIFIGWSDASCADRKTCVLQVDDSLNVTATFHKIDQSPSKQFLPFIGS